MKLSVNYFGEMFWL